MGSNKQQVFDYWNKASCGEDLYLFGNNKVDYESHAKYRYQLEPYILDFADFQSANNKRVLEVGVGLGSDHQCYAKAGADLFGIDLTERAVTHTQHRLSLFGLKSKLAVGDAECLDFPDEYFDLVYSWGVLHHSPDTSKAVNEVWRVLKQGGEARIMIYHKWSLVGLMLWIRYALLSFRPWLTLNKVYAKYLESPGTKAYTVKQARVLFSKFDSVDIRTVLTHGDLLDSDAGQRHYGFALRLARKIWPRPLFRRLFPGLGLFMLINARK